MIAVDERFKVDTRGCCVVPIIGIRMRVNADKSFVRGRGNL